MAFNKMNVKRDEWDMNWNGRERDIEGDSEHKKLVHCKRLPEATEITMAGGM